MELMRARISGRREALATKILSETAGTEVHSLATI